MSYYIDGPIMCAECGYLHGHHAVSCERQRVKNVPACYHGSQFKQSNLASALRSLVRYATRMRADT